MRILIVNPYGIGDVLFSLPLIYALREQQPDAHLSFLCNRRTQELVSCWKMLDQVSVFEKDEFRAAWSRSKPEGAKMLWKMTAEIRRQKMDALIDLSLGWQIGFTAILAGIPKRVGFDFRGRGRFLTHKLPLTGFHTKPVHDYYLDLLPLLGLPKPKKSRHDFELPDGALKAADDFLERNKLGAGTSIAGIVPGGGASWGPNAVFKQWPSASFAEAADHLHQRYGMRILLFGDAKEAPLCESVAARMKTTPAMAVGISSLLTVAGLLKRCRIVVGNDGGLMHLAASQETPTVAVFGPVDPAAYAPMPQSAAHRTVVKDLACRPCYQSFRFPPCPWDNACLKKLSVSEVTAAIDTLQAIPAR